MAFWFWPLSGDFEHFGTDPESVLNIQNHKYFAKEFTTGWAYPGTDARNETLCPDLQL
jgi:hypothetical protein